MSYPTKGITSLVAGDRAEDHATLGIPYKGNYKM